MAGMGTQEPAGQSKVERQQTERTGRWLCICQQAGFYLNRPLRLNRVHHPGQSQLYIGLLPFKFSGCPAAGCPKRPVAPRSVQRRVTEDSSHSGKMLTDRTSAKTAIGLRRSNGQQTAAFQPFNLE